MTPADELRAAAAALRPSPDDKARLVLVTVPAATADRFTPIGDALATLLEGVLSSTGEVGHEECTSWCNPQICDLSAALAVARLINEVQR